MMKLYIKNQFHKKKTSGKKIQANQGQLDQPATRDNLKNKNEINNEAQDLKKIKIKRMRTKIK